MLRSRCNTVINEEEERGETLAKRMMPPEWVEGVAKAMLLVCAPA